MKVSTIGRVIRTSREVHEIFGDIENAYWGPGGEKKLQKALRSLATDITKVGELRDKLVAHKRAIETFHGEDV